MTVADAAGDGDDRRRRLRDRLRRPAQRRARRDRRGLRRRARAAPELRHGLPRARSCGSRHGRAVQYWTVNASAPALMGPIDLTGTWWIIAFGVDAERGRARRAGDHRRRGRGAGRRRGPLPRSLDGAHAARRPRARPARVPRRRRGASEPAVRRPRAEHRDRRRRRPRLEARGDARRLGRTRAARQLRDRAAADPDPRDRGRGRQHAGARHRSAGRRPRDERGSPAARGSRDPGVQGGRVPRAGPRARRGLRIAGDRGGRRAADPRVARRRPLDLRRARRRGSRCWCPTATEPHRSRRRRAGDAFRCRSSTPRGLRDRYGADLVLVRPDQHVAWRGDHPPDDPSALLDQLRGVHTTR